MIWCRRTELAGESRVSVFDDAAPTVAFDSSVSASGDSRAIADVQLSQAAYVIGECFEARIGDSFASAKGEFFEIWASGGECFEGGIADITFAKVKCPESWTRACKGDGGAVTEGFAAPGVQVPKFVAMSGDDEQSSIGDTIAFADGEIPERGSEAGGEFADPEVCDSRAIGNGQLSEAGTIGGDGDEAGIGDAEASAKIEEN